jgi:hypothetical protein
VTRLRRNVWGTRAPARRPHRVGLTFAALTAGLGVAASACGSSGPSEGALAGKSATAVLSLSIKAYHRQHSVSFVTKTVAGKASTVQVGATSEKAASESVRSSTVPVLQAILVDGSAYLRAGTQFLEQQLSLSTAQAAAHAGEWISFQKGNPGYSSITQSLSAAEAILEFVPEEPHLRVAGATTFGGQSAVAVTGSPATAPGAGTTATVTFFVSTTAPYLPLGATVQVNNDGGHNIERVASVYGKYNQKVDPKAPTGAVPITSLVSS